MSPDQALLWRCAQCLGQILTKLLFNLQVQGRRNIPKRGGALIVSNHQSNLDPVVLAAFLHRPLNFVAKSELFHNPLGGWFLRRLNAFPLRQGKGDIGALKETIRRLREGHLLNIFPEGARSPDGRIHAFQKGVALIIRRANVPLIPAVVVGTFDAWPLQRPIWRMAPVRVRFGPPLKLDPFHTDDQITAEIEREIRRMFDEMKGSPAPLKRATARQRIQGNRAWPARTDYTLARYSGTGQGEGLFLRELKTNAPHPNPLPEYRARE